MKRNVVYLLFALILFSSVDSWAQFNVYGELRTRAESRYGYKKLPTESTLDPAVFVSQRSRIGVKWKKDNLKFNLSVNDARVWGDEQVYTSTGVFGNSASMDLFNAWFEYSSSNNVAIRIGRQPWSYDDHHLLSGRNWNDRGLLYDGALLKYNKGDFDLDMGVSWNSNGADFFGNNYDLTKIKTLNFLRLHQKFSDNFKGTFLSILSGKQRSADIDKPYLKSTTGAYLVYGNNPLKVNAGAYYQGGKNQGGTDKAAWMTNIKASLMMDPFVLSAGADILSGTAAGDEKDKSFDPLYGARHKYYGTMDQYSSIPNATQGAGLNDFFATAAWKAVKKGKIGVTYHSFSTNAELTDAGGKTLEKGLGSELDFFYSQKVHKGMAVKGGFSLLFPSETHESLKGVQDYGKQANWFWLMVSFKPTLFTSGE